MKTATFAALLLFTAAPLTAQDFHRWRVLVQQHKGWVFLEDTLDGTTLVDRQMIPVDADQVLYDTRKVRVLKRANSDGAEIIYFDIQVSCLHKTHRIIEARGYDVLDHHVIIKDDPQQLGFMPL